MQIEHEFDYRAELKPPLAVGPGPYGTRTFFEVTGGTVEGDRVSGELLSGGGDWLLVDGAGYGHLDVRGQIRTGDGAVLYLTYGGILEVNENVQAALGGEVETDWNDQYFRSTPRLETGDERYAWVNSTVFVAEGRVRKGPAVEYRVYRVV